MHTRSENKHTRSQNKESCYDAQLLGCINTGHSLVLLCQYHRRKYFLQERLRYVDVCLRSPRVDMLCDTSPGSQVPPHRWTAETTWHYSRSVQRIELQRRTGDLGADGSIRMPVGVPIRQGLRLPQSMFTFCTTVSNVKMKKHRLLLSPVSLKSPSGQKRWSSV